MNRPNMLIIEDDLAFALILTNNFSDKFNLRIAHSGKDALALLKNFEPNVVLLDYMLPVIKGDELFTYINDMIPDAEIIVLSANNSSEVLVNLIKRGVRNYVIKDENFMQRLNEILVELEL